jgi:hypothetical protein
MHNKGFELDFIIGFQGWRFTLIRPYGYAFVTVIETDRYSINY